MEFDIPQEPPDVKEYLDWLNLEGKYYESLFGNTLSGAYLNSPQPLPKTSKNQNLLKGDINDDGYAVFRASDGQIWVIKKIDYDINIFFRSKKSINRSRSPKKNKKSARKRKPCSTRKTSKRKPRRV